MFREWTQRVGSAVPRGFSRYYILQQLKEQPHTGKEIIDSAVEASAGNWKPSPGLIYPLLGRLLDEGLIEESENGKYQICLLYTSPSPRDRSVSRMPSSA